MNVDLCLRCNFDSEEQAFILDFMEYELTLDPVQYMKILEYLELVAQEARPYIDYGKKRKGS